MRLSTRLRRAEQAAAALPYTGPCPGCGGIDTAKECGWCRPGVVLPDDVGGHVFMCLRCPREWRGRLRTGPDGRLLLDGCGRAWVEAAGPGALPI